MTELLVCVDGSKKSKQVVDYSIDLAKKLSATIVLTYVASDEGVPEGYSEYSSIENVDLASYYEAIGEAVLKKSKEELEASGIPFKTLLDLGNPATRIIDLAKARNTDMIVIGMQGLHGFNRIRSLGSVSRRILENAPCPVVVVHEERT